MMSTTESRQSPSYVEPILRTVRVNASPKHAFKVFTQNIGDWWAPTHSIAPSPAKQTRVVLEPRVGGRWYEVASDGNEYPWGRVLQWEPPHRILLAWQISGSFRYEPELITEVEVCFTRDDDWTVVTLEHRNLERFGRDAAQVRGSVGSDGGWLLLLKRFVQVASASDV